MSSLYVISAVGKDKPGLVHSLTNVLSDLNINIVDADARAVRGHFSMFLVVDLITSKCSYEDMVKALETVNANFNLGLRTEKYVAGRRKSNKKLMVLTFMGRDRPGIVASISGILSENSINIEQIKMIARGEYIAIDLTIDTCDFPHTQSLRKVLYKHAEKLDLDFSLRNDNIFSRPKRVIVFDCDSTIIQQEVIDELAKTAGVDQTVKEITNKAMNGDIDFQESLRERVKLLKGLPVEKLELLINTIKLTPGAEELISTLRFMGYKIAVISGGFSFFTDHPTTIGDGKNACPDAVISRWFTLGGIGFRCCLAGSRNVNRHQFSDIPSEYFRLVLYGIARPVEQSLDQQDFFPRVEPGPVRTKEDTVRAVDPQQSDKFSFV